MCCRTASQAMINGSCRSCSPITKARAALFSRCLMSCGHNYRSSPEIATEGRCKSLVRQVKKHMDFRITADGNERDIREIHEMLKKYNLAHREASQSVPIGIFLEEEMGRKLAGLPEKPLGIGFASGIFLSANRSEGKASEARCWRLRNWMQNAAAANMPLWTLFPFRLPVFTRIMGAGRFIPSKHILTPGNGTIIRKKYFDSEERRQR